MIFPKHETWASISIIMNTKMYQFILETCCVFFLTIISWLIRNMKIPCIPKRWNLRLYLDQHENKYVLIYSWNMKFWNKTGILVNNVYKVDCMLIHTRNMISIKILRITSKFWKISWKYFWGQQNNVDLIKILHVKWRCHFYWKRDFSQNVWLVQKYI